MTVTSVRLLLSVLFITGCYGAAPPRPATIPLPPLADAPDAQIVVHSESKTTIENVQKQASTCPQGHTEGDPACVVTHYEVAEPVTRTISSATLDGEPISYAQLRVISDRDRDKKLAELAHLSHLCTRANVPRYVGWGLLIGSAVLITASGNKGPVGIAGWGALAGGIGSYAFGYYGYGGKRCNEANRLYQDLDVSQQTGWTEVAGADYATEMQAMAASFNELRGRQASTMRPARAR